MTEEKIRETFEKWLKSNGIDDEDIFRFSGELDPFKAGYLAMLNSLECVAWACWLDGDTERNPLHAHISSIEPKAYSNKLPLFKLPDAK